MSESTWSPTPAADSPQIVASLAAGYCLLPDDEEVLDAAAAGIRRAIDRLNSRTWNWALKPQDITFVVGTQEYTLETPFKAPFNFALRNAAAVDVSRLGFLPLSEFLKDTQLVDAAGTPYRYTVVNAFRFGKLRLDAVPTTAWTAIYPTGRLWYYRRVQYPGSSANTIDVPEEVVAFIQNATDGFVAGRFAPAKADSAWERAERAFADIVRDDCHGQQSDWE